MAEPTSVLGFRDLLLRVAEKVGIAYYGSNGQGKAIVPVDAYNLDKCKRIINDGFRLFKSSPPPDGWHWQERMADILLAATVTGTATSGAATYLADTDRTETNDYFDGWLLTITSGTGIGETAIVTGYTLATGKLDFTALSGDSTPDTTSTYMLEKVNVMPDDFAGQIDGPVKYMAGTYNGTEVTEVDESVIRALKANGVSLGYPQMVAFSPYEPTAGSLGSTRRWQMTAYPSPSAAHVLTVPYTSHFDGMDCETGTATAGAATSLTDSSRGEADDYFNGWILTIIAGTGIGQTATITDDYASGVFSFSALSGGSTPDDTSVYYVEPASNLHPAGMVFDDAIQAACYAEAEKQIEEINEGAVELFYKVHLPNAHRLDGLSRPRTLRSKSRVHRHRTYNDIHFWGEHHHPA